MPVRLEIAYKVPDTREAVQKQQFNSLGLKDKITEVSLIDIYTLDKDFSRADLDKITALLVNPVTQKSSFTKSLSPDKFSYAFEVGYLPGVTDNVASTLKEMIEDRLKRKFAKAEGVYTSHVIFITGKISVSDVQIISNSLYNGVIQRVTVKNFQSFQKDKSMGTAVPRVDLAPHPKADSVDLQVTEEELVTIGKQGIANKDGTRRGPLALDLTYMKTIQKHFKKLGRSPTDIELESIAQTWSEHCKHTIFADPMDELRNGLYETYIKRATEIVRRKKGKKDFCVSVFTDNSGAVDFDKNILITHKVETHNSPSALDPFGGSITGIVGVNRDTIGFGLSAKPIVNTYGFCFADPKKDITLYKGPNFTQKMLSSRRILDGVVTGVNSGGNCSGIPSPQGFLVFDESYRGKPLVFVGTVGMIPRKIKQKKSYLKKANPGDLIVMIGGRVGLDGIHGATFSSEAMDTGSPATAVQIGDPITQKKFTDALVRDAREKLLYTSITDNGAGGLSCSVAEMAKEAGGSLVDLEKVPLKYPHLSPWQIWISESQERMTLAIPKNNWKRFKEMMDRHGVEATIIGVFTKEKKCIVKYKGNVIMDLDMEFLHNGLPQKHLETQQPVFIPKKTTIPLQKNLSETYLKMLGLQNISSFEFVSSQFDHEVQGNSVLKPLAGRGRVNSDASVVKPLYISDKGIVLSQGLYPQYSQISTYDMAACSIDTAIRNIVTSGCNPEKIALLDNICWCSSNDPIRLGQLKSALKACFDMATVYETPFISGKDSMFNDFKGFDNSGKPVKISILPTLLVSSLGMIDDVKTAVSLDFKNKGDLIYIIGETYEELGASEYFSLLGSLGDKVPQVNPEKFKKIYLAYYKTIQKNLVASAISINRGGLAVALAKSAIGGLLGADVSLKNLPGDSARDDFTIFSESMGRILVSVAPQNKTHFEKLMRDSPVKQIGKVTSDPKIKVKGLKDNTIVSVDIKTAEKNYKDTFKDF